jgi:hypothetical protein
MINKLINANELIEDFKSAILNNVIVKIRDTNTKELLWCCHTDEYYGRFKKEHLEVEQDINVYAILQELKNVLEEKENNGIL